MPLYRCLSCGGQFEAAKPACAVCGIDPAADPRDGEAIVELVLHHFDPPSKRPGRGLGCAACNPKIRVGVPKCAFTGEPEHVNCAACRATAAYAAANGASNGAAALTPSARR